MLRRGDPGFGDVRLLDSEPQGGVERLARLDPRRKVGAGDDVELFRNGEVYTVYAKVKQERVTKANGVPQRRSRVRTSPPTASTLTKGSACSSSSS